jgi:hypothetical protein
VKNTQKILVQVGTYIVDRLRNLAPKDTGNLAFNSIELVMNGENKIEIYVSLPKAPYMPYTNEPWLSPKWNGKKNPNEAWWNDAIVLIMEELSKMLGGKLTNA